MTTSHGGKREGAGRPPKEISRNKNLIVRLYPNEHDLLHSLAPGKFSALIRGLIHYAKGLSPKDLTDIIKLGQ